MKFTLKQTLINKGLATALLLLLSTLLPGCFLFDNDDDPDPTPRSEVPAAIAQKWLYGGFSMGEFWEYDGTYTGNAFEAGIAFDFKPDGKCEFYLVAGGTSYSCHTEALTYKKGTVQFKDNNSFNFYPTEGRSRGFYKGCASSYKNYDMKIEKKDLEPEIFYYSLQQDSYGRDQLIIRRDNATFSTTFQPANW